ncbi:uncharacterized protein LOC135217003 [Macrobrachium nipponense]|uniref:uncharacterized protein LOC135217003 n=1 Tax=Macrobrachium nipponense TaxID=159736 RepID=UPI0030C853D8
MLQDPCGHEVCRSHAPCATPHGNLQVWFHETCTICYDLVSQLLDGAPAVRDTALATLRAWVGGFGKNAAKGQPYILEKRLAVLIFPGGKSTGYVDPAEAAPTIAAIQQQLAASLTEPGQDISSEVATLDLNIEPMVGVDDLLVEVSTLDAQGLPLGATGSSRTQTCFKENPGKDSGFTPVCISDKHLDESQTERPNQNLALTSKCQVQGQIIISPSDSAESSTPLVKSQEPVNISTPSVSSSGDYHPHGRFIKRLGRIFSVQEGSRNLVTPVPSASHKCTGSNGSVLDSKKVTSAKELPHKASFRQRSGSPSESCHGSHLLPGGQVQLAPLLHPYSWSEKRHSRCSIPISSSGVGMVTGQQFVPMDPPEGSRSTSGSIRIPSEPQTPMLCGPQPGPSGLCHGRPVHRLEQLGEDLCLSSSESSPEGTEQTQDIQGSSSSSSPRLAEEQLVPSDSGTGSSSSSNSQSQALPVSTNEDCVRFLRNSQNPNFMDFIKFAAKRDANIDPRNILFLESDKRDSTLRQYDAAVKKLATFLRESDIRIMTINSAISFFRSLFEKGLAASTITTNKSALKKIFQLGFSIDLTDSYFSSIPKACARLRPSVRPTSVSWFLNDVLKLASETDNTTCSFIMLLRITLFLLSLASGARISELSALSRDPNHVEFLPTGEVLLSPERSFIAKNEDPLMRWEPWKVVPLPQDTSLCPVSTLRAFLSRTSSSSSGPLFKREKGGTLSIKGIRQQILYFIKQANPDSFPKAHDVRAVATSINYFQHMNFDDLKKYTGWKSPTVFKRHYLKSLEALKFSAVAAGNIVSPDSA